MPRKRGQRRAQPGRIRPGHHPGGPGKQAFNGPPLAVCFQGTMSRPVADKKEQLPALETPGGKVQPEGCCIPCGAEMGRKPSRPPASLQQGFQDLPRAASGCHMPVRLHPDNEGAVLIRKKNQPLSDRQAHDPPEGICCRLPPTDHDSTSIAPCARRSGCCRLCPEPSRSTELRSGVSRQPGPED